MPKAESSRASAVSNGTDQAAGLSMIYNTAEATIGRTWGTPFDAEPETGNLVSRNTVADPNGGLVLAADESGVYLTNKSQNVPKK